MFAKLLLRLLLFAMVRLQACFKYKCKSLKDSMKTTKVNGKEEKIAYCFLHEKDNESLLFVDSKICLDGKPPPIPNPRIQTHQQGLSKRTFKHRGDL